MINLQNAIQLLAVDPSLQPPPPKWQEEKMKEIKTTNPGFSPEQVNTAITKMWTELPESDKSKAKSGQPTVSVPASHLLNAIQIISATKFQKFKKSYHIIFDFYASEEALSDEELFDEDTTPDGEEDETGYQFYSWDVRAQQAAELLLGLHKDWIEVERPEGGIALAHIKRWFTIEEFENYRKRIDAQIDPTRNEIYLPSAGVYMRNFQVDVDNGFDLKSFDYVDWGKLTDKQASRREAAEEENVIYGVDEKNNIVYYKEFSGSKFPDNVVQYLYKLAVVDQKGDSLGDMNFGMYYKVTFDPPMRIAEDENNIRQVPAAILMETKSGTIECKYYTTEDTADLVWDELERRYEKFLATIGA